MTDSAHFALAREELRESLSYGEQKIAELMKGSAQRYPTGHVLIEPETDHPYVYRIVRGWACRTRTLSDGRDQSILIFLPGDLFAVKSMLVMKHPDAVHILTDALIERIDYRRLHQACRANPDIADRCTWQVMEEERRLHNWVVSLGVGNAEERLALLLIDLNSRLQDVRTDALGVRSYAVPLTQTQLADHLGITPIHVNRLLRALREANIAILRDGLAQILDFPRLAAIARPLMDPYQRSTFNELPSSRSA